MIISNNCAVVGTAFILVQNSVLKLEENSHIHFRNNHAITNGGVFYITDNVHYIMPTKRLATLVASTCFLSVQGSRSQTRLTFSNNSAGVGGDILYGGHVSYGLDGGWNCLQSLRNISDISQNGLSLITSDPSRVCLCNGTGQPDCLILSDPTPHSIYPGQTIHISAVVVGQGFGTVAGSVYAQVTDDYSKLELLQKVQGVTQGKCGHLDYTILFQDHVSESELILTSSNENVQFSFFDSLSAGTDVLSRTDLKNIYHTSALEPILYSHHPVFVTVHIIPCPAGFTLTSNPPFKCDCDQLLQDIQVLKTFSKNVKRCRDGSAKNHRN